MTSFESKTLMDSWRMAGTIAMAGVALVYREAVKMLDERAARLLARPANNRSATKPPATAER